MNRVDFGRTNGGYRTSKNRVSIGLSLTPERASRIRQLASDEGISMAEAISRLIDRASEEGAIPDAATENRGAA